MPINKWGDGPEMDGRKVIRTVCMVHTQEDWPCQFDARPRFPWVWLATPDSIRDDWWWYCLCTGYSGEPTIEQAVAAAEAHAAVCEKGRDRHRRGWQA